MLHEIEPIQFHNEFQALSPEPGDQLLLFFQDQILLHTSSAKRFLGEDDKKLKAEQTDLTLPTPLTQEEQKKLFPVMAEASVIDDFIFEDSSMELRYAFSLDEQKFFVGLANEKYECEEYGWFPFRIFRSLRPQHFAFAGICGAQLYRFLRDNRFCGRCGERMKPGERERSFVCPSCHNTVYPKISPAVIIGVYQSDRLLMSRYAQGEYRKYALIAGFCEFGESLSDTVHREVAEEVGLKVSDLRFYKSQPWPFTDTLLVGFFAKLEGDDTIRLQEEELSEAVWFSREDIPVNPAKISLTNEMIEYFRNHPEEFC